MKELEDVNIRHIKLSTGEEIISIVLSKEDIPEIDIESDVIMVQRPMKIETVERDNIMSFLFYEWQPLSKGDTCFINTTHIVSHVECDDQVKGQYLNVCANGDSSLPSEPSDDIDSELDSMMIDDSPSYGPTYH